MELNDAIQKFIAEERILDDRDLGLEEKLRYAVNKAYGDMMLRTIPGHKPEIKKICSAWLTEHLGKFVKQAFESKKEYQEKHVELCNAFLKHFNDELKKVGANPQLFGKAQKVVNMAVKYLYCICDRQEYEDLFKYAHMPLDTYTLNWYYAQSSKKGGAKPAWSNLSSEEYLKIAQEISSSLEKQKDYEGTALSSSPLEADFIIWAGEKRKAALKELKSVLLKSSKDSDLIHSITAKDKKEMREYFEQIMQDRAE